MQSDPAPNHAGRRPWLLLALGALAAGCAAAMVVALTPWGINTSPDSSLYVGGARSLLDEGRLWMPFGYGGPGPLTHFPPLYPAALAAADLLGGELAQGARWLHAALFALNVVLAGAAARRYAPGSRLAPALAMLLALASLDLLYVHVMAWSEPLYLAASTAGFVLLAGFVRARSRRELLLAAAAVGAAWVTRYVGAAAVAAGVLGILLLGRGPARTRLRDALAFAAAASLPMALWIARNLLVAERATNRDVRFHPVDAAKLREAYATAADWVLPVWLPGRGMLFVLAAAAVAGGAGWMLRRAYARARAGGSAADGLPVILALYAAAYLALLLVSITLFDRTTPLDFRILSPLLFALIPILACTLAEALRVRAEGGRRRIAALVFAGIAAVVAANAVQRTASWITRYGGDGQVYGHANWRTSPLLGAVRGLPPGVRIHSNLPEAVYLLAGRTGYLVPRRVDALSGAANARFAADLAAIGGEPAAGPRFVVYFEGIGRPHLATEAELARALRLRRIGAFRDGRLYEVVGAAGEVTR